MTEEEERLRAQLMRELDRWFTVRAVWVEAVQRIAELKKGAARAVQKSEQIGEKIDALADELYEASLGEEEDWGDGFDDFETVAGRLGIELEEQLELLEKTPKMLTPGEIEKLKARILRDLRKSS